MITVDGSTADWFNRAPISDNTGLVARNGAEEGEYVWKDAVGDERNNFADPDPRVDITTVHYTGTPTHLNALVEVVDLPVTSGSNTVQVQLAIDTDHVTLSGGSSFVGDNTAVDPGARWERLLKTRFGSGNGTLAVYTNGVAAPVFAGSADNAADGTIELSVPWTELGLGGPPATPLRFTVASFRTAVDDNPLDLGPDPAALDVVTDYGDPGTAPNTASEVSDGTVDYFADVHFTPLGEARAPLVVYAFSPNHVTPGAEWIELANPTSQTVNVSAFKVGDEASATAGGEGMASFPVGTTLPAATRKVVARDGAAYQALYGLPPDYEFVNSSPSIPNMDGFGLWTGGLFDLADGGDEVVVLDGSNTTVDVISFGPGGIYPGITPKALAPTVAQIQQRMPSLRDTDNTETDFRLTTDACAGTKFFDGGPTGTGDQWDTAVNWSGNTLPVATDDVCIPNLPIASIVHDSSISSVRSVTSDEVFTFTGGTLNLTSATQPSSFTTLEFTGGTIGGAGNVTVSGPLAWSGGSFVSTTTATKTTVFGTTTITGTSTKSVVTRTFELGGDTTMTGGDLQLNAGALLRNLAGATFTIGTDGDLDWGHSEAPRFVNAGSVIKSSGNHAVDFTHVEMPVDNTGSIAVNAGMLRLDAYNQTSNSTGSFSAAPNTYLDFAGAAGTAVINLNAGSDVSGQGVVRFISSRTNVNGSWSHAGPLEMHGGTAVFQTAPEDLSSLAVFGGVLSLATAAADLTVPTYTQTAGTLNGLGDLTVTGATTWTGGLLGSTEVATKVRFEGGTTLSGAATKQLERRTLELASNTTLTGGDLQLNNGALLRNLAGSTFTIGTDGDIDWGHSEAPRFDNDGALVKSAGNPAVDFTHVEMPVDNDGSIAVNAGLLRLDAYNQVSSSSGSFSAAANSYLDFAGAAGNATINLNPSSAVSGAGIVRFISSTTNVNGSFTPAVMEQHGGASNINVAANLTTVGVYGGTLGGSGNLTVANFIWQGGTHRGASVATTTTVTDSLQLSGNTKTLSQRTFNNNVPVATPTNWTGTGDLNLDTGAIFNHRGRINVTNDVDLTGSSGTMFTVHPGATFAKTGMNAAVENTHVTTAFDNNGSVLVETGYLRLIQNGSHSGAFQTGSGGLLGFEGGTQTSGGPITGDTAIPAPTGLTATPSTPGGSLATGTYFYKVTALNFNGETLGSGEASADVTGPSGRVTLSWDAVAGATNYRVYRGTASNAQNVFYTTGTSGTSFVDTGAAPSGGSSVPTVNTAAGRVYFSGATITLNGSYDVPITLHGAGTSRFDGATTLHRLEHFGGVGNYNDPTSPTWVNHSAGTIGGSGNMVVADYAWSGGVTSAPSLATSTTVTNSLQLFGTTKTLSQRTFNNETPAANPTNWTGIGDLDLQSGAIFNHEGRINVAGDSDLTGNAGTTFNVLPGAVFAKTGGGESTHVTTAFHNDGSVLATTGYLRLLQNGSHSGPFHVGTGGLLGFEGGTQTSGAAITGDGPLPTPTGLTATAATTGGALATNTYFYKVSALNINGETLPSAEASAAVTGPTGRVNLAWDPVAGATSYRVYRGTATNAQNVFYTTGSTSFVDTGAGASAGSPIAVNNTHARVYFSGANITLNGSYSVPTTWVGGGTPNFSGPTAFNELHVFGGTAVMSRPNIDVAFLSLSAGAIGGLGQLTVAGPRASQWTGGSMVAAGTTLVAPGVTLNLSGTSSKDFHSNRIVRNEGSVVWTAGDVRTGTGGRFENVGVFDVQTNANFNQDFGGTSQIVNTGTFKKTTGTTADPTDVSPQFDNDGTVLAGAGSLRLHGGDGPNESTGVFDVQATLDFANGVHDLGAASSVTGPGIAAFTSSQTTNLNGTYDMATTAISGGTALFHVLGPVTDVLTMSGGTLAGTGRLTLEGPAPSTWTGGDMSGAGTTRVGANATLNITGGPSKDFHSSRVLRNEGTAVWTGTGALRTGTSAALQNVGLFDVQTTAPFNLDFGGTAAVQNTGTFRKSAGAGNSVFSPSFTNSGRIEALLGTLTLNALTNYDNGTKTLTGGTYAVTDPGILRFPNADVQTNAATIVLSGGAAPLTTPSITDTGTIPADALRAFRTNAVGGDFSIVSGRNLPALGAPNTLTNHGTLRGTGTYFRDVTNHGKVAPGASPGILTVAGSYTQSPTGTLEIEVGGTTDPGTLYDRLVVTGTASLDGTLRALLFGGFVPVTGVGIDVVTAASRTGTFDVVDSVPTPMPGNLLPEARYDQTTAKLFAVPGGGAADDAVPEGAGTKSITVTLSAASSEEVSVHYATADGTADAGDYTSTAGDLVFPAGHTSKSFDVAITDDTRDEPDQTFLVNLSSASSAVLTDTQATVTIADNDALPSITVADHQHAEGSFGPNGFVLPVTLSAASEKTVAASYATAEHAAAANIATSGVDFAPKAGTVTFEPGDTAQSITVDVEGDTSVEFDEQFLVNLTSPVDATFAKASAVVSIVDDDQGVAASKLSVADVTVAEIDGGALQAVFTVTLAPVSPTPVTVQASTVNGSAVGGSDFTTTSVPLIFAPGETTKQVAVPITGDNRDETTETFGLTLTGAVDGAIDDGFALGTITDDDATPALVTEAILVATEDQTSGAFTLVGEDADDDPLTYKIVRQPDHGSISDPGTGDQVQLTPSANFNGSDTFTVEVSDGTNTSTGTYQIQVAAQNDAPVVLGESRAVLEDGFADIDVLANDTDVDGDVLTLQSVGTAGHGTVEQLPDGRTLRYRPAPNYNGPDSFPYTVRDGAGALVGGTVTMQVLAVNDAPIALDQAATTAEETAKVIGLGATDDATANPTRTIVSGPAHGTLGPISGSQVTYTPNADFTGVDTFRFAANDGELDSAPATVTVTVTPVNDAPVAQNLSRSFPEDTPETITLPATDVDGDTLTYSTSEVSGGTVTLNGKEATFTPTVHYHGPASFKFRATDSAGAPSNQATASLTITPVNDVPLGVHDDAETAEDTPVEIDLVANDLDVDGDTLILDSFAPALHGEVTLKGDGRSVVYTPDANFHGSDSFLYVVSDGQGGLDAATADVTVSPLNDQPVALDRTATVAQGVGETIVLQATDVDGDALTYSIVSGPGKGTLSPPNGNAVTYTANSDATGVDTFTFRVSDGSVSSDPATVTISISAGGGATSQISIDNFSVTEGDLGLGSLTFTVTRTLAGSGPASVQYATVGGSAIEGVDYVGESGTVTFAVGDASEQVTVDVIGDRLDEGDESVFVTLSGASGAGLLDGQGVGTITDDDESPVAVGQSVATAEDTARPIVLGANDGDGDGLALTIVDQPAHGTLSGSGADRTYTPAANYNGPDSFTFRASDGANDSNLATVAVTVTAVNDAPVATDVSRSFAEDTAETIPLPATDVEGGSLTYSTSDVVGGNVIVNGNEATFTPTPNYHGPASFKFQATDPAGATSNQATAALTITPVNDAPVANDAAQTTAEDTAKAITLTSSDVEGSARTYSVAGGPAHGTLSAIAGDQITYTPDANYHGADSFRFKANDGGLDSAAATISLTVTPVNDAPVAHDDESVTVENAPRLIDVLANDDDVDSGSLAVIGATGASKGTTTVQADSRILYDPATGAVGTDSFTYTMTDGDKTDTAIVEIEIFAAGTGGATLVSLDDAGIVEGNAGEQGLDVRVALTRDAVVPVEVRVSTNNGSATGGQDYGTLVNQRVDFAVGEREKTVRLKINGDTVDEADETFSLVVASSSGAGVGDGSAAITITDDDPEPSLSIGPVDVNEGNAGSQTALLTVNLSAASGKAIGVDYSTADGVATQPIDYTPTSGRLTFAPGETSKTIAVSVHGDSDVELNETLTVQLSNAANAGLAAPVGTVTIVNDDSLVPPPPPPPPPPPAPTVATADLALTMSGPSSSAVDRAVTFDIVARNNGPDAATGVVVTDALPSGMQLVSANVGQTACSGAVTVSCPVGNLASGASALVTVIATTLEPGVHTNTAAVSGSQADPAAGNNSASATTRVPVPVVREPARADGCTQRGTSGDDILRGTPGVDIICGLGGDDVLMGFGGNDRLLGGAGNDQLLGGAGKDLLKGGAGKDHLLGGGGDDRLDGGRGADILAGERGNDTLLGSYGNDYLSGGSGKDRNLGGPGKDIMRRDGQDVARGGPGGDRCVSKGVRVRCP